VGRVVGVRVDFESWLSEMEQEMAGLGPVDPEEDESLAGGEVAVFEPARDHVVVCLGHGGGDNPVRMVLKESRRVGRDRGC
jgi:hypothetical protein